MNRSKSEELFKEAKELFPGGVNSPVRAFGSVNGNPIFVKKGDGCRITDADGNEFIDFCCSWGPLLLGHNNSKIKEAVIDAVENGLSFGAPTLQENELGRLLIDNNKFIEKIRFVNSGTEAVMSAIRLARGFTKKNKIIKFEGCYHGHADHLLVKAGSGLATFGTSSSAGVPEAFANETIVLPLNDKEAIVQAFENHKDDVACIIIEPVPANNGLLLQDKEYLEFLREITAENDSLLIFDEVISGFRLGFEGAAGYYNIQPDIITYGKIIGGGMPVGAYGSSKKIMAEISPDGGVYQAGTLSGNPVAMAAGIAQVKQCLAPNFYSELNAKAKKFIDGLQSKIDEKDWPLTMVNIGSIFWFAFSKSRITAAHEIEASTMDYFRKMHEYLLEKGVYLGPSGYEVGFVSAAHTAEDLQKVSDLIIEALEQAF